MAEAAAAGAAGDILGPGLVGGADAAAGAGAATGGLAADLGINDIAAGGAAGGLAGDLGIADIAGTSLPASLGTIGDPGALDFFGGTSLFSDPGMSSFFSDPGFFGGGGGTFDIPPGQGGLGAEPSNLTQGTSFDDRFSPTGVTEQGARDTLPVSENVPLPRPRPSDAIINMPDPANDPMPATPGAGGTPASAGGGGAAGPGGLPGIGQRGGQGQFNPMQLFQSFMRMMQQQQQQPGFTGASPFAANPFGVPQQFQPGFAGQFAPFAAASQRLANMLAFGRGDPFALANAGLIPPRLARVLSQTYNGLLQRYAQSIGVHPSRVPAHIRSMIAAHALGSTGLQGQ